MTYTIKEIRDMINDIAEHDPTEIDMVAVSEMLEEYMVLKMQVGQIK